MAAPRRAWGAAQWALNLIDLISAWKRAVPRRSGTLHRALDLHTVRGTVKTTLRILVNCVYARISDQGGRIPERPKAGPGRMTFFSRGKFWTLNRAAGFDYPASRWVSRGFEDFWGRGNYRGQKPIAVGWQK